MKVIKKVDVLEYIRGRVEQLKANYDACYDCCNSLESTNTVNANLSSMSGKIDSILSFIENIQETEESQQENE